MGDEDNQLFHFFLFCSYLENKVLNLLVGVEIVFGCVRQHNVLDFEGSHF